MLGLKRYTSLSLLVGVMAASLSLGRLPQQSNTTATAAPASQTVEMSKSPQRGPELQVYTAKPGDTIEGIAASFKRKPQTILWANPQYPNRSLAAGDKVTILPLDGVLHRVRQDETVESIAALYGVKAAKLIEVNRIPASGALYVGDRLVIPGGQPTLFGSEVQSVLAKRQLKLPSRGAVTSSFGSRFGGREFHHGVDLRASIGTPVRAVLPGKVQFSGWYNKIYGNFVIIDHGDGLVTRYAHNSRVLVKAGQRVAEGQTIAESGETGRTFGPHIHFEVKLNGKIVNPLNYAAK